MATAAPFSLVVIKKAFPALVVIFFIFVSLMFLISYTDAFYLVILMWIVLPVLLVNAFRRLRGKWGQN
ncbi:MAG: hypothetical protein R6W91_04365 [Thermoplasmata archaeon]